MRKILSIILCAFLAAPVAQASTSLEELYSEYNSIETVEALLATAKASRDNASSVVGTSVVVLIPTTALLIFVRKAYKWNPAGFGPLLRNSAILATPASTAAFIGGAVRFNVRDTEVEALEVLLKKIKADLENEIAA